LKKENHMAPLSLTRQPLTTSLTSLVTGTPRPVNQIDPVTLANLLKGLGFGGNLPIGIPPIQLPPFPVPAPTPQPASTPLSLQALLSAIPIAADGHVITSEYHNTLRSALLALAQAVGAGLASTATATTIAPVFVLPKNDPHVAWDVSATGAKQPVANPNNSPIFGWMPIQLPHGEVLQGMTVYGTKKSAVTDLTITLSRYSLTDTDQTATPLIKVSAKDGSGAITASNVVTLPLVTSAASLLDDLKLIDNTKYKYLITANLVPGGDSPVVELTAIQITCGFS
jgi:hypothetical protein